MNTRNSTETVWVETTMHRCTELDAYIPPQTMRQGRDCTNPAPRISMLAGKPTGKVNKTLVAFWSVYIFGLSCAVAWAVLKVTA